MLKPLIPLLTLLCSFQLAQAQFTDDFTDGDFTNNPAWSGDNGLFTVTGGELNSQSPGAATYYLSTASTTALNAQWDFYFNLKFSTSGANYVDVYLMSDVANVTTPNNGYFVRIGGTTDEVSLYKVVAGTPTILIDGPDGSVNSSTNNPFDVRVTRDAANNWTLYYDDGAVSGLTNYGTVNDNSVTTSGFFGIAITQSSAASPVNNHFFDNFSVGPIVGDTSAPQVDSVVVLNANNLDVYFNEPVDLTTSQTLTNYSVDGGIGNPTTANRDALDSSIVHLAFASSFSNGQPYNLTINNVEDTASNPINTIVEPFTYLVIIPPVFGDVMINEIFADPTPQIGLPNVEYVELYNNSNNAFVLNNWQFVNSTTAKSLPNKVLAPNSYVILCNLNDTALFSSYGDVIGISSFVALTNGGDSLTLLDNNSNIIDIVVYSDSWYQDAVKDDGGWSLELINPKHPCTSANNWIASTHPDGGTPGTQNSVFDTLPDTQAPNLTAINTLSTTQIQVIFNEKMDSASLASAVYSISNGIAVTGITVHTNLSEITLDLNPALTTSILYTLNITGAGDCAGNALGNNTGQFALPEQGLPGDLVINEILFNPFTGGSDFVEIYNNSGKYISLENWSLANLENDSIDNYKTISTIPKLVLPGEFVLLTKDPQNIEQEYINAALAAFLKMETLPTYNNDEGDVYLISNLNAVIDEVHYNEDMHFALLNSVDGVSLERIDYNRPSNDVTNWHSAAEDVGFATPGYENSQYMNTNTDGGDIVIDPESFSPDNDGVDDVVNISYNFPEPGYVANIVIYDAKGRLVRNLVKNELLGTSGTFSWDGTADDNEKGRIGIYIIFVEAFDLQGNTKHFKKTCVLAGRLD
ncbi:MAG: lamin tail domain-containing protein [Flavobacteriales bacterium]|nr:lamin tail domain-containing protein [Flavobacteriales bacterium]